MSKHFSDLISARLQNVCSVKGATFTVSLGQRPKGAWHKKTPVLKARFKSKTGPLGAQKISTRLKRTFSAWLCAGNRILGRCPRFADEIAPLALSRDTGLKPGVGQKGLRKPFSFVLILVTVLLHAASNFAAQPDDAEYDAVAEEYIKT